jgi:hypothetical protein
MRIGIIGSGNMGAALGSAWVAKGHAVLFSFAKDQDKLRSVAAAAGPSARAGTPAEAARFVDLILLSVPWDAVPPRVRRTSARLAVPPICAGCKEPPPRQLAQRSEVIFLPGAPGRALAPATAQELSGWLFIFALACCSPRVHSG